MSEAYDRVASRAYVDAALEAKQDTLAQAADGSYNIKVSEAKDAEFAEETITAQVAHNATNDTYGNPISTTYATKAELAAKAEASAVTTALATKADKATTLSGYGITDGATQQDITDAISAAIGDIDTALDALVKSAEDL